MNPLNFKYTITMTQSTSPSKWNLPEMYRSLAKIRDQAYETEAQLIERELDRRGYGEAKSIIDAIKEKK